MTDSFEGFDVSGMAIYWTIHQEIYQVLQGSELANMSPVLFAKFVSDSSPRVPIKARKASKYFCILSRTMDSAAVLMFL